MPYYRCADCGISSYSAIGYSTPKACANCSAALPVKAEPTTARSWDGSLLRLFEPLRADSPAQGADS